MELSDKSISALGSIVTGDRKLSPYRSGQQLVDLFSKFGAKDSYRSGFPSRWKYAELKLQIVNAKGQIPAVIRLVFDPAVFKRNGFDIEAAVEYVNKPFASDGVEVVISGNTARLISLPGVDVAVNNWFERTPRIDESFVAQQFSKCESKLAQADYDGAITNARSLLEAVLVDIEDDLDPAHKKYDGNLPKLYRRVQNTLRLDPSRNDIDATLKQMLGGLSSIVHGIASARNAMSDSHVRSFKPAEYHARLVVNSAKTVVDFLAATKHYESLDGDFDV